MFKVNLNQYIYFYFFYESEIIEISDFNLFQISIEEYRNINSEVRGLNYLNIEDLRLDLLE